jgi:hypothetical protein
MNKLLMLFALATLAGCASQDEKDNAKEDPVTEAVLDFIEVRNLEEVDAISSGTNDGWTELNLEYLLYEGRRDTYLVEFARPCYELRDQTRITPDKRWDSSYIRARFDTIRGCRIGRVFPLTEAEVAELENIGEAPGSRN